LAHGYQPFDFVSAVQLGKNNSLSIDPVIGPSDRLKRTEIFVAWIFLERKREGFCCFCRIRNLCA